MAALSLTGCGDSPGFGFIGWRDGSGPEVKVVSLRESDSLPGLYELAVSARERFTPPLHLAFSIETGAPIRIDSLPVDSSDPSLRTFRIDLSPYSGRRTLRIEAVDGGGNPSRLSVPILVRSRMACGVGPASSRTRFAEDANGDIWAVDGGLYRFDPDSLAFLPVPVAGLDSGGSIDGIAADGRGRIWLIRNAYTRGVSLHAFDGRSVVRSETFPEGVILSYPRLAFGDDDALFGIWQQWGSPRAAGIFTLSDTGLVLVPLGQEPIADFAVDGSGLLWLVSGVRLIAYDSGGMRGVDSVTPSEGVSNWPLSLDASGRIVLNSGTHRLVRADTGWVEDPYPPGEEACFEPPGGEGMWCFPGTVPSHATYYRSGSAPIRQPLEAYVPRFLVDSRGRLWTTRGRYSGYCGLSLERF